MKSKLQIGTKVTVKTSQRPYYWNCSPWNDKTTVEPMMIGIIKSVNCPSVTRSNVKFHVADFDIDNKTYRVGLMAEQFEVINEKHALYNLVENLS